ncbi:hypothetical protein FACS18948_0060 [Clostridia bacterium]|nr:hypothetical protein FACS18948_0060 [Clostridia bacterium]
MSTGSQNYILELVNVSKRFGPDESVLEDICLGIRQGEIFGLIGRSGAGKSTLARCVNLLTQPTSGDILFEGKSLVNAPSKELYRARQSIGMIFQQFNLLMQRTVLGNVLFPMEIANWKRDKARARAKELLALVNLSQKENAYPSTLSGGQKQRVAIARALALNPKALICDEATSALDPETTRGILSLLKDINEKLGVTIIIITHEMHVIESICQRVAIIDNSRIAEVGAVQDIFTNPQTEAARSLVYQEGRAERLLRVIEANGMTVEEVLARVGLV